ncbi:MAG: hypothetical protein HOP33_03515 [Verrucomicrobia bacterium]|nr:hypothetical protein [Verrucomicrobiota bacterium]
MPASIESLNNCSRRRWIAAVASATLAVPFVGIARPSTTRRRDFHLCLAPPLIEREPELLDIAREAGVETVWLAGFFYGFRPYPTEQIIKARQLADRAGLKAELITIPLGHPGDSLGSRDGDFPLTPPPHWRLGERFDGKQFAGTSLHEPATEENSKALRDLRRLGFRTAFVDDDFRLARGPGEIGGCYCAEHRAEFLHKHGYSDTRWSELLDDVRERRFTRLLRSWVDWTCDQLSDSFRAQQRAFNSSFGNMIMYLGAEKAGIRLRDYRRVPVRVGELMFDDVSFGRVKGKTDELFSVLFHRRFVEPDHAYSETTAYPADKLSANNIAAKLTISTIADVRHTMFMSGLTPFPRTHWTTLGPAMREQARIHELVAGHKPRGPFKHVWGEAQRYVGDDQPFSLWLAAGVPFEVVANPARDGWNFLSDFDAREISQSKAECSGRLICRKPPAHEGQHIEVVPETLDELFAFKRRIRASLVNVPVVEEETPVICAWYPSAKRVLLWNLLPEPHRVTVSFRGRRRLAELGPLGSVVMENMSG